MYYTLLYIFKSPTTTKQKKTITTKLFNKMYLFAYIFGPHAVY